MNNIYIIFGVSGCGKTTIGKLLSKSLTIPFLDADAFHSKENIQKMTNGIALTDTDRKPWLENINRELIQQSQQKGAVLACSALKESYRSILSKNIEKITWIYLKGEFRTIQQRMQQREHFMNVNLLQSQFDTLEEPTLGMQISIEKSPENILAEILKTLQKS